MANEPDAGAISRSNEERAERSLLDRAATIIRIYFTYAQPETMVDKGDLLIVSGPAAKVEAFAAIT